VLDEAAIETLQAMKTGALLQYACAAGAIPGKAGVAERAALGRYGSATLSSSTIPQTFAMG
jgi:farnesyl diphosphate synthase